MCRRGTLCPLAGRRYAYRGCAASVDGVSATGLGVWKRICSVPDGGDRVVWTSTFLEELRASQFIANDGRHLGIVWVRTCCRVLRPSLHPCQDYLRVPDFWQESNASQGKIAMSRPCT